MRQPTLTNLTKVELTRGSNFTTNSNQWYIAKWCIVSILLHIGRCIQSIIRAITEYKPMLSTFHANVLFLITRSVRDIGMQHCSKDRSIIGQTINRLSQINSPIVCQYLPTVHSSTVKWPLDFPLLFFSTFFLSNMCVLHYFLLHNFTLLHSLSIFWTIFYHKLHKNMILNSFLYFLLTNSFPAD